jgi:hypothetical protein
MNDRSPQETLVSLYQTFCHIGGEFESMLELFRPSVQDFSDGTVWQSRPRALLKSYEDPQFPPGLAVGLEGPLPMRTAEYMFPVEEFSKPTAQRPIMS